MFSSEQCVSLREHERRKAANVEISFIGLAPYWCFRLLYFIVGTLPGRKVKFRRVGAPLILVQRESAFGDLLNFRRRKGGGGSSPKALPWTVIFPCLEHVTATAMALVGFGIRGGGSILGSLCRSPPPKKKSFSLHDFIQFHGSKTDLQGCLPKVTLPWKSRCFFEFCIHRVRNETVLRP